MTVQFFKQVWFLTCVQYEFYKRKKFIGNSQDVLYELEHCQSTLARNLIGCQAIDTLTRSRLVLLSPPTRDTC